MSSGFKEELGHRTERRGKTKRCRVGWHGKNTRAQLREGSNYRHAQNDREMPSDPPGLLMTRHYHGLGQCACSPLGWDTPSPLGLAP